MSLNSKPPIHTAPLIFLPQQPHKTTLIILHGRGSTAQKFAEPLLSHPVSPLSTAATPSPNAPVELSRSFRDHLPNTKFVFPTAPLRRAVIFNRSLTHQWFDNWSLEPPGTKQHLQIPGLRETSTFLHDLIRKEMEVVGPENVILMGLSQGCAASIITALLWEGEVFGALIGMCGYLLYRKEMHEFVKDADNGENDLLRGSREEVEDIFERDGEGSGGGTKFERAVEWLQEELQISREDNGKAKLSPMQSIPIFMGHGTEDDKVPCDIGRLAADFLKSVDVPLDWKEYEGLGHWYSEDMLRDIVEFLKSLER